MLKHKITTGLIISAIAVATLSDVYKRQTMYTESDVPDAQEEKAVPLPLFPTGKCTV